MTTLTANIFGRQMTRLRRINLKPYEQNGNNIIYQTIGDFVSLRMQKRYIDTITKIRSLCHTLEDKLSNLDIIKSLKATLPAGIVSGTFLNGIGEKDIVERNNVVCIDIDAKDNPAIYDWEALKREMTKLPYVAYAGLSVTGLGIYVLIPVADGMRHKEHFDTIKSEFTKTTFTIMQNPGTTPTTLRGIKIDPAPGNISSKRFVSYDPYPYINTAAEVYTKTSVPVNLLVPRYMSHAPQRFTSNISSSGGKFDVESFFNKHNIAYNVRQRDGGLQYVVTCPWSSLHSSTSYADSTVFAYSDGRIGYKCMHAHCANKHWHEYREFYEHQSR